MYKECSNESEIMAINKHYAQFLVSIAVIVVSSMQN